MKYLLLMGLAFFLSDCSDSSFSSGNGQTTESRSTHDRGQEPEPVIQTQDAGAVQENEGFVTIEDGATKCNPVEQGLVGKLYRLPAGTGSLPNFPSLVPVGQVRATNLNVPDRSWTSGFPGVENLVEWFAIDFVSVLSVPATGRYFFKTVSDDGSNVYLDGNLVVGNDGLHSPRARQSSTAHTLQKGEHRLRVSWYQGPRTQIALQLFWRAEADAAFSLIPNDQLQKASECDLVELGQWP